MKMLTALADKHQVKMSLSAKAFGDLDDRLTTSQLKSWYGRLGFKSKGDMMFYTPKS